MVSGGSIPPLRLAHIGHINPSPQGKGEKEYNMLSKRDIVKATLSTETAKNHVGEKMKVVGIDVIEKVDSETGEITKICAIKREDGCFITAISSTLIESVDVISDLIADEGFVELYIKTGKSNSGREYLTFDLV